MEAADRTVVAIVIPLAIAWLVSIPVGEIARFRLLGRLRRAHPQIWSALGQPTFWWNASPKNHLATLGWVLRRRYQNADDPDLVGLASTVRIATVIQLGIPVLFIVMSALEAVLGKLAA
jgi:hypothetical protein